MVDASGEPIAAAVVTAAFDDEAGRSAVYATSDRDGRFRVRGITGEVCWMSVRGDAIVPVHGKPVPARGDVELVVERGSMVSGRLIAADGLPAIRAHVTVEPKVDSGASPGSLPRPISCCCVTVGSRFDRWRRVATTSRSGYRLTVRTR